jgi:uncharacterized protein YjbI with pentapeptide repeats
MRFQWVFNILSVVYLLLVTIIEAVFSLFFHIIIKSKSEMLKLRISTLLYATLRYSTLLYATLRYSTLLYATLRYSTLLYATLRYSTLLYATLRYSTLLYDKTHTILLCTIN